MATYQNHERPRLPGALPRSHLSQTRAESLPDRRGQQLQNVECQLATRDAQVPRGGRGEMNHVVIRVHQNARRCVPFYGAAKDRWGVEVRKTQRAAVALTAHPGKGSEAGRQLEDAARAAVTAQQLGTNGVAGE